MSFKSKTVIGPRKKNPLPVGNKALSCGSVTPRNNPLLRKVNSSREFSIKELKEGNINAINKYIRASNDVNKSFENGKRLIHFASKNGEIQSVELLIYSGSNLNATDANGCTALDCVRHKKGCSNFIEIATLLVMHGGWTWGITKNEEISIDADVITGNIEAVKQYIADGNNINKLFNYTTSTKHKCGLNLLHLAFNGGHKEIAQLLISNGVDLEAHNADGKRLIQSIHP